MSAIKSWQQHKNSTNPFDESNKIRLEQSVLSPNLFHIPSNHSSTEKNSNCIWNIDQRAVLYPADIPTDETSLLSQYICDHKINKQINAAVEAFWSQNMTVIESPATNAAAVYRARMLKIAKNNSNFNSPCESFKSNIINKLHKNHEEINLHPDFEMDKMEELKHYFEESPTKELNTSIRKKLFDHNNDEFLSPKKDSTERRNSLGYQDQAFFSPKCKIINLTDIDMNTRTPDLSPFITRKTEKLKFQFNDFISPIAAVSTTTTIKTTYNNNNDDLNIDSPNLSPIKENLENMYS